MKCFEAKAETSAETEINAGLRTVMTRLDIILRRFELWQIQRERDPQTLAELYPDYDMQDEIKNVMVKLHVVQRKVTELKGREKWNF